MRILFVSNVVSLWRGGHTRNILLLAKSLKMLGVSVEFFCHYIDDEVKDEFIIHHSGLSSFSIKKFAKAAEEFIRQKGRRYDILHLNGGASGFAIAEMTPGIRPPVVLHLRAANYQNAKAILKDELLKYKPYFAKNVLSMYLDWYYDIRAIENAEIIFCNSRNTQEFILKKTKKREEFFSVLHNGVDSFKWKNFSLLQGKRIGYFAQFNLLKGWKYFFDIAKKLVSKNSEWKFVIAGRGPFEEVITKKLISSEIEGKIKFFGKIETEEQRNIFFAEMSVFLCPTAPGTTTLEALSRGVRVIVAKRQKDPADGMDLEPFIDIGVAQLLVNEKVEIVVEEIENMVRKNLSLQKWHQNLIKNIEDQYLWDRIARQCLQTYTRLL